MSKEELKKYLDNENVQWFLYQIFKGESDKDNGVINLGGFNQQGPDPKNNYYSSSAFGSQQFTGITRNEILEKYGIDAWSKDVDEQQIASIALLSMDGTLEDVAKGDYDSTISRRRWEAFAEEKNNEGKIVKKSPLRLSRPSNWKEKYNNLKNNAVYDPKKSWEKIPNKNKIGKIRLFNGKTYGPIMEELGLSDTINSNINAVQLEKIKNLSNQETYEPKEEILIGATVPTEEEASEDPRYARKESPRLDEVKDFIKQWKEIQNSERVDKDKALRNLAETHPGFKYTVPNYVKGKTKGHTGGINPKNYTVGHTEKNVRLLRYHRLSDVNRWINESEPAILKQADAADQISIGVKPSLVLKGVDDNLFIGKDEKNNIPATKENLSPTPVMVGDSKVENFVELPEVIDTDLVEEAEKEPTTFMGPDGKFYPYQTVEPGQEDEITTKGLLDQDQENELIEQESEQNIIVDPNTGEEYFDLRGDSGDLSESFLDKMGGVSSLIGLATGAIGLGQALKNVDIPKDPKLGPAFQQRLAESKRMAQQGLTPSELAKAHNDLDSSYSTGIDNIVRGSAGNRAQFLAGLGGLDVARQSALMDIAVADAQMQRQNQEKYDSMMLMNEQYEAARQAKYQDAKFQQDTARQAAGAALVGNSIAMISDAVGSRHLNRYNKMKTEKLLMDMGYKSTKEGKSGQPKLGEGVQTSYSVFNNNNENPSFNLLNADDQVVNTNINNQPSTQNVGTNLINTSPLNTSSGLINNTVNEINLGDQMFDIFNTQY